MHNRNLWLSLSLLLLFSYGFHAHALEVPQNEPTRYVIILIGTELLEGTHQDAHTQYITRTLGPLGCRCMAAMAIGDEKEQLLDALQYAYEHADFIITTGGLGPTDDDITRQTLSEFTGIPLKEDPEVVAFMKRRFNTEQLRENLLRQTRVPERGTYLNNANGTAVGLVFDKGEKPIVALPGPPRELQPMVSNELLPLLEKRFGIHKIGSTVYLRFAGIGESNIDQVLHEKMDLPKEIIIAALFEHNRVDFRFSLPGNSPADYEMLNEVKEELKRHLGDYVYSEGHETLEDIVLNEIDNRKGQLTTAEVGSGGIIAASLNASENAHRIFLGGYVAPSNAIMLDMLEMEDEGLEGEALAKKLAEGAAKLSETQWALAVTEAVQEENSNRMVWVALGNRSEGFITAKIGMRGQGESMRSRFVTEVLERFRKQLQRKNNP